MVDQVKISLSIQLIITVINAFLWTSKVLNVWCICCFSLVRFATKKTQHFLHNLSLGIIVGLCLTFSSHSIAEDTLYTIKAGDTLWDISKEWLNNAGDWKKLQTINNIKNPSRLIPNSQIRIPALLLRKREKLATLKFFQGDIIIKDAAGSDRPVSSGMAIHEGDRLFTGAASYLQIEFLTGSQSSLQESSQLTIKQTNLSKSDKQRTIQLHLQKGHINNIVKPKSGQKSRFIITTPSAVASVRGTTFRVANDPSTQKFHAEVLEGVVNVSSQGQTVTVKQGFGVLVKKGFVPNKPSKLLSEIDVSKLPGHIDLLPVFFRFDAIDKAMAYRVQLSKGKIFSQQIFGEDITRPEIRFSDLKNGNYVLRIFAYDKDGLGGKIADHNFEINVVAGIKSSKIPELIFPDDQSLIADKQFLFEWSITNSGNGYHFQLANDKTFNQLEVDIFPYHYESLSISDRLPSGSYYWHVATLGKNNKPHVYTDARSFRILPPTQVLSEAKYVDNKIQLNWRTEDDLKKSIKKYQYRLQISRKADFSELLVNSVTKANSYQYEAKEAGDFYMRVLSLETDNFVGPTSNIQYLTLSNQDILSQELTDTRFAED